MARLRISIYWKIFLTILASTALSSFVIGILYIGRAPQIKTHPHIQKSLIQETRFIAAFIIDRYENSSSFLEEIVRKIHQQQQANLRVFDQSGRQRASAMQERLKDTQKISQQIIESTLETGYNVQLMYPKWVLTPVVSIPLHLGGNRPMVLQCYYPFSKSVKSILPRGLAEVITIIILGGLIALLTRYLTRPIRELTRLAKDMGKGNFGAQVTIRSHDEVGELAKNFNNMSQHMAKLHKSRRELFTDISHELRSPLARILTDAEILIDRQMEPHDREQHLKAICNEVKNLDQLIGDLAILSRSEHDTVTISPVSSSLQDVISQAVSLFMLQIEEQGIILKQHIAKDVPPLMIDPTRIGQIISNLIMNALRYTPARGTIEIGLTQKNSTAEVWVKDTGEGIPAEKLPYIFDRFYRVDSSRSRSTGGSGLGLAIAKQFIESHGGTIRAQSNPEEGTCIWFTLPISQ